MSPFPTLFKIFKSRSHQHGSRRSSALLSPSEKRLSLETSSLKTPRHRISNQLQSSFFTKLPLEIRQHIYSFLIPQSEAVQTVDRNFRTMRLPMSDGSRDFVHKHTVFWQHDPRYMYKKWVWPWRHRGSTPVVLLVCWRMHNEVADTLYSTRKFYFDSPKDILDLYCSTRLEDFNRITAVRFVFCSNFAAPLSELNIRAWNMALDVLLQMPSLQSFHVLLAWSCWDAFFRVQEAGWGVDGGQVVRSDQELAEKIENLVPFLLWVKEVKCVGDVVVQIFGTEGVDRDGELKGDPIELRLKGGMLVRC